MNYNIVDEPWIESPFFYEILKKKKTSTLFKKLAIDMHENGYCVFNLNISNKFIDSINHDISSAINSGEIKKNPKIYHYNENPRVVEAWKYSKKVALLANNSLILKVLRFLYDAKPLPFSTINFIGGTEQPFHSDYIHFGSVPEKYLVGAWVALEPTHEKNGPLAVIPKSHKLPIVNYQLLKQKTPTTIKELEKSYRIYEDYIKHLIKLTKLKKKELHLKKGEAILWSANLIHGGTKMIEKKSTRKSQVIHYHFNNSDFYYNPGFSDPKRGLYMKRKLDIVRS